MAVDAIPPAGLNSVTGAIRKAARATGTSFDYLLATARVESDLNPNLTMRSSTATGLFQFIEQTWLGTLKQAGPAFGYGQYADAISQTASGRYVVTDPALRDEIMQLRKDPTANALMGGVFTQQNAAVLADRIGRTPTEGELYIGHFFGPYAGAKAINLAASNPTARAADIFPAAAAANQPIFYDKQGNARSIAGVCAELKRRYQAARAQVPSTAVASVNPPRPPASIPGAPVSLSPPGIVSPPVDLSPATPLPAVAPQAPVPAASVNGAAAAAIPIAYAEDTTASPTGAARPEMPGGMFHSLFQTGERREAVSPAISELWRGQPREGTAPAANSSADQNAGNNVMLGLFRDPH
jgi:transglycosylase-like protein with SLT domain